MVIHCKTNDESKALYDELCRIGNMKTDTFTDSLDNFKDADCNYRIEDLKHETWSFTTEPATVEFSDLIIPDQELSAEEALLAYDQMCREHYCCNDCPIYGIVGHECAHKMDGHITEIVDVIKKWKADREKKGPETEKKEPEIETVDICRIVEVLPDGRKRCVHEEDIKSELPFGGDEREKVVKILKRYCMEHDGEYIAVHEVVSRVKDAK